MEVSFIVEDNILDVCFLRKKDAEDLLIIGRLYLMRLNEEQEADSDRIGEFDACRVRIDG